MADRESGKGRRSGHKIGYFLNILFLCAITLVSLVAALILFFRLQAVEEKEQQGSYYTDSELENLEYSARQSERSSLLLEIQSSFESGNSTLAMLRGLFPNDLVVMSGGRYYFYPVQSELKMNGFEDTDFATGEDGFMEYVGDDDSVSVTHGIDVSSDDGYIDWQKVSEDQIAFAMLRIGRRDEDEELVEDEYFESNLSGALSFALHAGCYIDLDADSEEEAVEEAQFVLGKLEDMGVSQSDLGAPIAVRVEVPDDSSDLSSQTKEEWTQSVVSFCEAIEEDGYTPMIYGNVAAFHMLLNLSELEDYEKWIADTSEYLYFPYEFSCWQYSASGTVDGISGNVSLDLHISRTTSTGDS